MICLYDVLTKARRKSMGRWLGVEGAKLTEEQRHQLREGLHEYTTVHDIFISETPRITFTVSIYDADLGVPAPDPAMVVYLKRSKTPCQYWVYIETCEERYLHGFQSKDEMLIDYKRHKVAEDLIYKVFWFKMKDEYNDPNYTYSYSPTP